MASSKAKRLIRNVISANDAVWNYGTETAASKLESRRWEAIDYIARLEAVAEAAKELRDRYHEASMCVLTPPCGDCIACRFERTLAALARGDGDEQGETK
jgi:hypothetical protein